MNRESVLDHSKESAIGFGIIQEFFKNSIVTTSLWKVPNGKFEIEDTSFFLDLFGQKSRRILKELQSHLIFLVSIIQVRIH